MSATGKYQLASNGDATLTPITGVFPWMIAEEDKHNRRELESFECGSAEGLELGKAVRIEMFGELWYQPIIQIEVLADGKVRVFLGKTLAVKPGESE